MVALAALLWVFAPAGMTQGAPEGLVPEPLTGCGSVHPGSAAFSPDSRLLAMVGGPGVVLWDAETGEQWRVLPGGGSDAYPPLTLLFSPDSRTLATVRDGMVALWDVATGQALRSFDGYTSPKAIAFSPDWKRLALADEQGVIALWDMAGGERLHTLLGHHGPLVLLTFTPDGATLLSASADKTAVWWDAATGTRRRVLALSGHEGELTSVVVSPNGATVVSWSTGPSAMVARRADSGVPIVARAADPGALTLYGGLDGWSLRFSPDGRRMLETAGGSATLRDAETGAEIRRLPELRAVGFASVVVYSWTVAPVAFSPDGRLFASSKDRCRELAIFSADTGEELRTLEQGERVHARGFSPDGRRLAVSDADGLALWDTATWEKAVTLPTGAYGTPLWSPDGRRLMATLREWWHALYDADSGEELARLDGLVTPVRSVAFRRDELAALDPGGRISFWDLARGALGRSVAVRATLDALVAPRDERALQAVGFTDTAPGVWDSETGETVPFEPPPSRPASVSVSADGGFVAAGTSEGIFVSNAATGRIEGTVDAHGFEGRLTLSADGLKLAFAQQGGRLTLWDRDAGGALWEVIDPPGKPVPRCFSPDGEWLATSRSDYALVLRRVPTGEAGPELRGHEGEVWCASFSPDGRLVASGSADGAVIVWDVAAGRAVHRLRGHWGSIVTLAFTSTGRVLASGGDDGMVKLWDTASGELLVTLWAIADLPADPATGDDREWLAWTPDGYYAASPGAERLIHFRDAAGVSHRAADYPELCRPEKVAAACALACE